MQASVRICVTTASLVCVSLQIAVICPTTNPRAWAMGRVPIARTGKAENTRQLVMVQMRAEIWGIAKGWQSGYLAEPIDTGSNCSVLILFTLVVGMSHFVMIVLYNQSCVSQGTDMRCGAAMSREQYITESGSAESFPWWCFLQAEQAPNRTCCQIYMNLVNYSPPFFFVFCSNESNSKSLACNCHDYSILYKCSHYLSTNKASSSIYNHLQIRCELTQAAGDRQARVALVLNEVLDVGD